MVENVKKKNISFDLNVIDFYYKNITARTNKMMKVIESNDGFVLPKLHQNTIFITITFCTPISFIIIYILVKKIVKRSYIMLFP